MPQTLGKSIGPRVERSKVEKSIPIGIGSLKVQSLKNLHTWMLLAWALTGYQIHRYAYFSSSVAICEPCFPQMVQILADFIRILNPVRIICDTVSINHHQLLIEFPAEKLIVYFLNMYQ